MWYAFWVSTECKTLREHGEWTRTPNIDSSIDFDHFHLVLFFTFIFVKCNSEERNTWWKNNRKSLNHIRPLSRKSNQKQRKKSARNFVHQNEILKRERCCRQRAEGKTRPHRLPVKKWLCCAMNDGIGMVNRKEIAWKRKNRRAYSLHTAANGNGGGFLQYNTHSTHTHSNQIYLRQRLTTQAVA